ncbi:hypothetical protein B0A48_14869 [Cryoendolithus antarcticus]|uniref:Pentacotripeptide-repeat region of PRORP domain-containing protein n=1 Tax=Cryoendolithus antarcticus TaxID=1507870 RepID=A0A1V8SIQ0_9PEZI|nr:hypothetical protein B0A48_14869 [Cryoendolithus antarcticus]
MSLLGSHIRPQIILAASRTLVGVCTSRTERFLRRRSGDAKTQHVARRFDAGEAVRRRPVREKSFEEIFIGGLHSATQVAARRWYFGSEAQCGKSKRCFSTTRPRAELASAAAVVVDDNDTEPTITKDEYLDLVNTYGLPSDMWDKPKFGLQRPPTTTKQDYPLAPRLVLTAEQEDMPPYAPRKVLQLKGAAHVSAKRELDRLRRRLLREPGTIQVYQLWENYRRLPTPRPRYLSDKELRALFAHLAFVEFTWANAKVPRNPYLTLLEECVAEDINMEVLQWSTAINFTGRGSRHITTEEVKAAVELWMRMEQKGIEANHVTFNILYYIAIKAGRFALADTIFNELRTRKFELDRYFRITQIYYAGMRGNGDEVRRAFNNLVNAGEIVDSAVMNCVIRSLLQAGEAPAAEHVFERMKRLHEEKYGTHGPAHWQGQRKLARLLNETSKQLREDRTTHEASFFGGSFADVDKREAIQRQSPIAPTPRTYRTLLRHHARESGDMGRILELLEECRELGIPMLGSVYYHIFFGFRVHGGYSWTLWSPSALEGFWQDFLDAMSETKPAPASPQPAPGELDHEPEPRNGTLADIEAAEGVSEMEDQDFAPDDDVDDSYDRRTPVITAAMATTVLRAFYQCKGRARMQEVYEQIQNRWRPDDSNELANVKAMVDEIARTAM